MPGQSIRVSWSRCGNQYYPFRLRVFPRKYCSTEGNNQRPTDETDNPNEEYGLDSYLHFLKLTPLPQIREQAITAAKRLVGFPNFLSNPRESQGRHLSCDKVTCVLVDCAPALGVVAIHGCVPSSNAFSMSVSLSFFLAF